MSAGLIDIILGFVLVFFTLKGLWTGLVRTLVTIAAVVLGWVAMTTVPGISAPLVSGIAQPGEPGFVLATRIVTLAGVYVLMQLVGFFLAGLLEKTHMTSIDKVGGMLLGAATGVLASCLPLAVMLSVPVLAHWDYTQRVVKESFFLKTYTPIVRSFVHTPPRNAKR